MKSLTERLLDIWYPLRNSAIGRYVLAAMIALTALLLRLALVPILGQTETYTTLFAASILIAMLVGFWPAILIGVFGTLVTEYFLIPPLGIEFDIPTAVRAALMVLSSGFVGMLGDRMRRSQQQAVEEARQLDARTKDLESVIAIVSHDLRAPLVNVKGFSTEVGKDCKTLRKLLSDISIPDENKKELTRLIEQSIPESLKFIGTSADFMNNLAKSLVEVARAGMAAVRPEKLDMDSIAKKIIGTLEFKFKEAGAEVRLEPLPPCTADRQQVTQIITNLLDNAVKYLDRSRPGQIRLSGKVERNHAVYCVEDNGIGIAPQYQEQIFELFQRLGEKVTGGEGIGLAMVKRMLERNNGRIWLESEKGKGSRFFVSLPP
jgi:signal transduction histidine kinase